MVSVKVLLIASEIQCRSAKAKGCLTWKSEQPKLTALWFFIPFLYLPVVLLTP